MDLASLSHMPTEILDMILEYLDEEPPSYFSSCKVPNPGIISSKHKHPPIKALSRVCRAFRAVVIPRLFRHTFQLITIDARKRESEREGQTYPAWPRDFGDYVNFLESSGFSCFIQSFALVVKEHPELDFSDCVSNDPDEAAEYKTRWKYLLLDAMPFLRRITIVGPPFVVGMVSGLANDFAEPKEHDDYQVLSLWITSMFQNDWLSNVSESYIERWPLWTARPWSHLLLNDGPLLRITDIHEIDLRRSHFLSTSLYLLQEEHRVLPKLCFMSYTGVLAPAEYLRSIRALVTSFPSLVRFEFSLQWTDSVIEEALQLGMPLVALEDRYSVYSILTILSNSHFRQRLASRAGVTSYLDNLTSVVCLDEVSFLYAEDSDFDSDLL